VLRTGVGAAFFLRQHTDGEGPRAVTKDKEVHCTASSVKKGKNVTPCKMICDRRCQGGAVVVVAADAASTGRAEAGFGAGGATFLEEAEQECDGT
jgi:hypothetical protein